MFSKLAVLIVFLCNQCVCVCKTEEERGERNENRASSLCDCGVAIANVSFQYDLIKENSGTLSV